MRIWVSKQGLTGVERDVFLYVSVHVMCVYVLYIFI